MRAAVDARVLREKKFRLAQHRRGNSPWIVVPLVDDEVLAAAGYHLAGPGRDATALPDGEWRELLACLCEGATSPPAGADADAAAAWRARRKREPELLAKVPFTRYLPPLDLDPSGDVPRAALLAAVGKLDALTGEHGLGRARWDGTGGRGVHGDLLAPDAAASVHLLANARERVRALAAAAGIPVLSDHRAKAGRPGLVVDDTLYERQASSRGVVWTLHGAVHDRTGRTKGKLGALAMAGVAYRAQPAPGVPELGDRPAATIEEVRAHWAGLDRAGAAAAAVLGAAADAADAAAAAAQAAAEAVVVAPYRQVRARLHRFAEALKRALPGEGRRHHARMAAAGLLLRAGVPALAATLTLAAASADDPRDAAKVVATTKARLDQGKPVSGLPRLVALLGDREVRALQLALERDLRQQGVRAARLPSWQWPTKAQRAAARAAEQPQPEPAEAPYDPAKDPWAVNETRAKRALRRRAQAREANSKVPRVERRRKAWRAARSCGVALLHKKCCTCKTVFCKHRVTCGSTACLWCHAKKQHQLLDWVKVNWPERVWVTVVEWHDGPEYWRCLARKWYGSTECCEAEGRWVYAPGYLAHVATTEESARNFAARQAPGELVVRAQACTREEAAQALVPVLAARVHHLHDLYQTGASVAQQTSRAAVQAMAWDEWVGGPKESTASEGAVDAVPWPDDAELRKFVVAQARAAKGEQPPPKEEARLSPCCKAQVLYAVEVRGKYVTPWLPDQPSRNKCLAMARGARVVPVPFRFASGRSVDLPWYEPPPGEVEEPRRARDGAAADPAGDDGATPE